jgi:hypothetical protein
VAVRRGWLAEERGYRNMWLQRKVANRKRLMAEEFGWQRRMVQWKGVGLKRTG